MGLALVAGCAWGQWVVRSGRAAESATRLQTTAIRNRWIVTYRAGEIPLDAERGITGAGGRLLARHDRLGIAVVDAGQGVGRVVDSLRHDPRVLTVVQDRVVQGDRLRLASAATRTEGSFPHGMDEAGREGQGAESGGLRSKLRRSLVRAGEDWYYADSPQGWAVKQVGGYGQGIAGGTEQGPWNVTMGRGVRIAILDSGVDMHHPDIAPNLVLNKSEVDGSALASACDDGSPQDQQGHGTWTASLAAGAIGSGTGEVAGVAPQAEILNIKVLQRSPGAGADLTAQCESGEPSGLVSWVLQGIEDAMENHADVISMSLGVLADTQTSDGAGLVATFNQATSRAAQAGIVLVAAAGNDGMDLDGQGGRYVELPAQAAGVLAVVASTNPACGENLAPGATCTAAAAALPYYSNHGTALNAVAAPGGSYPENSTTGVTGFVRGACSSGVPSTVDGLPGTGRSMGCFGLGHQQYVLAIGTSASTPLVGGVAALVKAAHPGWTSAQIVTAIQANAALPGGAAQAAVFNHGIVNAAAAIAAH